MIDAYDVLIKQVVVLLKQGWGRVGSSEVGEVQTFMNLKEAFSRVRARSSSSRWIPMKAEEVERSGQRERALGTLACDGLDIRLKIDEQILVEQPQHVWVLSSELRLRQRVARRGQTSGGRRKGSAAKWFRNWIRCLWARGGHSQGGWRPANIPVMNSSSESSSGVI